LRTKKDEKRQERPSKDKEVSEEGKSSGLKKAFILETFSKSMGG
jgi:hypothetical protein